MLTVALLAAADTVTPDNTLLNYGVLGVFAVILLGYAYRTTKREQDRGDKLEEENRRLNTEIRGLAERFAAVAEQGIAAQRESRDLIIEMRAEGRAADRYGGRT